MPEHAIEVRGVTKTFRRRTVRGGVTTLKSQVVGLLTGRRRERFELRTSDVLKGVDLLVPAGQTLGIIGQNGSGKSTLLKLLTGIYTPTSGTVTVRGRLSALLELGAGFHPEFSGRENILINGVILGLSRAEIRARLDEIVAFSELGDFIDEPVRTYSSGMYMRLAFAVATLVDPEVLIIDEILSVGDEYFTRKSRMKMEEFKERGKTIVLVTHDLTTVENWCDAAAWLDDGRIAAHGDPRRVVAAYRQKVAERQLAATATLPADASPAVPPPAEAPPTSPPPGVPPAPIEWGARAVVLREVRLLDGAGAPQTIFEPESAVTIEMDFERLAEVDDDVVFGVGFFREDGLHAYGTNTQIERFPVPSPLPARGTMRFQVERLCLNDGNYSLDVAVASETGVAYDYRKGHTAFAVRSGVRDLGYVRPPHRWELVPPAQAEGAEDRHAIRVLDIVGLDALEKALAARCECRIPEEIRRRAVGSPLVVATHVRRDSGEMLIHDGPRSLPVAGDGEVFVPLSIPREPGHYRVEVDLLVELKFWASSAGVPPASFDAERTGEGSLICTLPGRAAPVRLPATGSGDR